MRDPRASYKEVCHGPNSIASKTHNILRLPHFIKKPIHPSFTQPLIMADPSSADQSVAWKVLLGSIASVVLATAAVVLRLIARRLSDAPFWWDDYTIVAALVGHSRCLINIILLKWLIAMPACTVGHGNI